MQTDEFAPESISGFQLSPMQLAQWRVLRGGQASYARARVIVEAAVSAVWLASVLEELAARNSVMRAALHVLPGMDAPLQVIRDRLDAQVVHERAPDAETDAVHRLAALWSAAPVPDWQAGGLIWPTLVDLPGGRQLIQLVAPTIIADAESLVTILRAIVARIMGDAPCNASEVHYLHYSEWCREAADSNDALDGREHWRRAAEAAPLRLPFERAAQSVERRDITVRCAAVGEHDALCAWAAVLGRYGDTRALTLHRRFAERPFAELADAVGPMTVHLPLRFEWLGDDPWPAFVASAVDAIARADDARPMFDPGRWPAGADAIGFAWRDAAGAPGVDYDDDLGRFALALHCVVDGDAVALTVRFDPARHDPEQIARLADALAATLDGASAAGATIDETVRCGDAERALLERWSRTDTGPLPDDTLHARFSAVARRQPDAPAVRAVSGELSFAALDRASNAIAARLVRAGVTGGRVALIARREPATIAAILGILKAGAAFVPVDPANPPQRSTRLIEMAEVAAVLGALPDGVSAAVPVLALDDAAGADTAVRAPLPAVDGDAPAYVIFTSGSTGTPKGVVVGHRAALNLAAALQARIYREHGPLVVSVNAPFSFDASIKQIVQLVNGHCLALIPEDARRDGAALLAITRTLAIDVLDCTPSHLKLLLAAGFGDWRLPRPSIVLVGGEPIDPATWLALALHPAEFWNVYGPTEATVNATVAPIKAAAEPNIGRPLRNVSVRLVDAALRPVPIGVPGEILIGGAGVALGYLGDPSRTAARFPRDPFTDDAAARVYRSGDRAVFDASGNLCFIGRLDDQLKIRGYRIEPGEIAAAAAAHPGVASAHVGALDGDDGAPQLVAWYVPRNRAHAVRDALLPTLEQINPSETEYLYQEIFVDHAYGSHGIRLPDDACVFDVGANIGMFSIYVSHRCVRPVIHAFEPIPAIYAVLARNLARHAPAAVLHRIGLSSRTHDETFTFYPGYSTMSGEARYADAEAEVAVIKQYLRNQQAVPQAAVSAGATALLENADVLLADRFREERVECRLDRLSDVIRREGIARIDLLKIDVQRAEADVLAGIDAEHWPLIAQVVMEVHDGAGTSTEGRLGELVDLLEARGFRVEIEQGELLHGTDRYNLYAQRAEYCAALGDAGTLSPDVAPVSEAELRAFVGARVADYMVPAAFVELPALPLTVNGKIDRAALPAPGRGRRADVPLEAPASREEQLMVEVWREVLGVDEVGVNDNFFQLGGDSIRSIQVHALAQRRGLAFNLSAILRHQTIRKLVRESGHVPAAPAGHGGDAPFALLSPADRARLPAGVEDAYPLSAMQAAMLYHVQLGGRASTYHNATAHEVHAPLDASVLEAALAATIATHPVLRTSFDASGFDTPLQRVHAGAALALAVFDLTGRTPARQRAALDDALRAEAARAFDFAAPPLLRVAAFRLDDQRFALMVAEFHGILDGWSLHLLIDEICGRYGCGLRGEPWPAVTLATSCRRFVELERDTRESRAAQAFWRDWLAGARQAALPRDAAAGSARATVRYQVPWPAARGGALAAAAQRCGVPMKSLLLAVHLWAIAQASGSPDVVTGLVVNGRPEEADGERVLGLFINMPPFRLTLAPGESWAALARRAFAAEGAMAPHRRMPLADIQQLVGRAQPLFDSFFNFTHFRAPADGAARGPRHGVLATIPVDIDFPLAVDFELAADADALNVYFQYEAADFARGQIERLAAAYRDALDACAADPDAAMPAVATACRADDGAARHAADADGDGTPRPGLETDIARIWADTLGLERVGRLQSFHALGGHSLLAVRVRARLARELGLAVPLSALGYDATVARIARIHTGATA
ncbi:non-ribosomal peptide synthetase [Burkholderia ubonensis]|uniref:non-ribosomal peptide synthetase n=1 Tax=Burkholderia ubonensis TaxID=101571 RepID=UPI000756C017|nr:non-ribosomal peptide synthetase [Burkholderia ubonensis]KWK58480.1 hypothetical protein WM15_01905 [Burkholderia ubonensis]